jgi:hypothetical protein
MLLPALRFTVNRDYKKQAVPEFFIGMGFKIGTTPNPGAANKSSRVSRVYYNLPGKACSGLPAMPGLFTKRSYV